MSKTPQLHNLDIQSYSLYEIYDLLKLPKNPTQEDMVTAKRRVLMFHPDKSRLPNEYFLFYRKAYTIVEKYYEENNKMNRDITTVYSGETTHDKDMDEVIKKNIKDLSNEEFNKLFETNMVEKKEYKNEWFKDDKPHIKIDETVSTKNINSIFETIKEKNVSSMVLHKQFQELSYSGGNKLFDDENDNSYISSDPFSKLKYDDLRKVHKDQTIFAVGEKDFNNIPKYTSVEHYAGERGKPIEALSKEELRHLSNQDGLMRDRYNQNLHRSTMETMKYEDKNKQILATFMKLKN